MASLFGVGAVRTIIWRERTFPSGLRQAIGWTSSRVCGLVWGRGIEKRHFKETYSLQKLNHQQDLNPCVKLPAPIRAGVSLPFELREWIGWGVVDL
jgi:hypothetical protein